MSQSKKQFHMKLFDLTQKFCLENGLALYRSPRGESIFVEKKSNATHAYMQNLHKEPFYTLEESPITAPSNRWKHIVWQDTNTTVPYCDMLLKNFTQEEERKLLYGHLPQFINSGTIAHCVNAHGTQELTQFLTSKKKKQDSYWYNKNIVEYACVVLAATAASDKTPTLLSILKLNPNTICTLENQSQLLKALNTHIDPSDHALFKDYCRDLYTVQHDKLPLLQEDNTTICLDINKAILSQCFSPNYSTGSAKTQHFLRDIQRAFALKSTQQALRIQETHIIKRTIKSTHFQIVASPALSQGDNDKELDNIKKSLQAYIRGFIDIIAQNTNLKSITDLKHQNEKLLLNLRLVKELSQEESQPAQFPSKKLKI